MFTHETQIRIRYAETDQMGYVYYGNYASFYEVARTEMLRSTGFSYKELEEMGVMMPVMDLTCKYYQPARYDDLITIRTTIKERPLVRLMFEYEIFNEQGTLLNTGSTQLVFVDMKKNRPCKAPQIFQDKMDAFFG
ncbi:acyl-CoA thioesterase [Sphingobacterium psychroaquaticum]|uniref:Acyl-CoA thioester hydrolase n=1 Tax=Sphingobacterium psychroaquaticum TaxID=561061 RepID=A0A1X7J0G4_9SPHI|nr:thioesterase family protein [Sphingobacterium psychroaquaticum]QBQ40240.1 acyl-CoA thioesterase [Sphingobacterium psychroaquaticum]SMG20661.1 acyl-CoA thioester hydrolase [Sphingobacterium psychroaquaticum]